MYEGIIQSSRGPICDKSPPIHNMKGIGHFTDKINVLLDQKYPEVTFLDELAYDFADLGDDVGLYPFGWFIENKNRGVGDKGS